MNLFFSFSLCLLTILTLTQTEIALFLFQVNTAVKFLENPKVRQSPLATREAFLKKKGEQKKLLSSQSSSECLEICINITVCVFDDRNLVLNVIFEWRGGTGQTGL